MPYRKKSGWDSTESLFVFGRMQFETACSHWMPSHLLHVQKAYRRHRREGLFYGYLWLGGWALPDYWPFPIFSFRSSYNVMRECPCVCVPVFGSIRQGAGGAESREPHNVTRRDRPFCLQFLLNFWSSCACVS